tara:strand:+ start:1150 stop:5157 length:4008 start_codon:yes stop_codon:yes gene_type:complete
MGLLDNPDVEGVEQYRESPPSPLIEEPSPGPDEVLDPTQTIELGGSGLLGNVEVLRDSGFDVEAMLADERERRLGMEEQRRASSITALGNVLGKSFGPTGEGGVAPISYDVGAQEALAAAEERGLPPGFMSREELRTDAGVPVPEGEPSLIRTVASWAKEKALDPSETWYGKVAQQTAQMGAGAALGPFGALVAPEAAQIYRQVARPPGDYTVRDPTVLSTIFDVLETPQRILLSPFISSYTKEGTWETMGKALAPPTWIRGQEPKDAIYLWRQFSKDQGWNPDSWGNMAAGLAFAIATDPLTWLGVGAVRRAATLIASEQATKIAAKGLRRGGMTGHALEANRAAAGRNSAEVISKIVAKKGDLGAGLEDARPVIRNYLEKHVSPDAAREFDDLGDAWGKVGLRVGVPIAQERVAGFQKELVSAATLGKGKRKIKAALPSPAITAIDSVAKVLSPMRAAGFKMDSWPGVMQFYRRFSSLSDAPEHAQRVLLGQVSMVSDKIKKASPLQAERLVRMTTEEMPKFASDAERVEAVADVWATMVLDMPRMSARERWVDGTLVPTVGKADKNLENTIRGAYSQAIIDSDNADEAVEAFRGALTRRSADVDGIDTLVSRAARTLPEDMARNTAVVDALPSRLEALIAFNKSMTDEMLAKERAQFTLHAERAGRQAYKETRARKAAEGLGREEIEEAAQAAKIAEADRVMKQATQEIDNYFMHFLRNKDAIRRRGFGWGVGPEVASKQRKLLTVYEDWEQGLNPALDITQSLAARTYAHIRMSAKHDFIDLVFKDKKWAVPIEKSKGLTKKAGWDEMAHPITGAKYALREEVYTAFQRANEFHEPGVLEKMASFYDSLLSRWKSYATHGRPVYYNLRNMVDDGFRMWMGGFDFNPNTMSQGITMGLLGNLETAGKVKGSVRGVRKKAKSDFGKSYQANFDRVQDSFHNALRSLREETIAVKGGAEVQVGKIYDEAANRGIVEKGYASADLMDEVPDYLGDARRSSVGDLAWKAFNPFSKKHVTFGTQGFYLKFTGRAARASENARRLTMFIDRVKKGDTFDEAARHVKKWMFDYKDLTPAEREFGRRVMPFYTFLRKSVPATVTAMIKHPGRYMGVQKGKRSLEAKAESQYGPIGVVREYFDDLHAIRLPTATKEGSPVFWSPGLSYTDLNVFGAFVPGMKMGQDELWDRLTPVMDMATLFSKKRDPRTGLSLRGRYMEPDAFLLNAAKAYNKNNVHKVPIMDVQMPTGASYEALPAHIVKAYNKLVPNLVAYGRLLGRMRVDPFGDEAAPYRQIREATGQSLLVNNPLKAEIEFVRKLRQDELADVAATPEGTAMVPVE